MPIAIKAIRTGLKVNKINLILCLAAFLEGFPPMSKHSVDQTSKKIAVLSKVHVLYHILISFAHSHVSFFLHYESSKAN